MIPTACSLFTFRRTKSARLSLSLNSFDGSLTSALPGFLPLLLLLVSFNLWFLRHQATSGLVSFRVSMQIFSSLKDSPLLGTRSYYFTFVDLLADAHGDFVHGGLLPWGRVYLVNFKPPIWGSWQLLGVMVVAMVVVVLLIGSIGKKIWRLLLWRLGSVFGDLRCTISSPPIGRKCGLLRLLWSDLFFLIGMSVVTVSGSSPATSACTAYSMRAIVCPLAWCNCFVTSSSWRFVCNACWSWFTMCQARQWSFKELMVWAAGSSSFTSIVALKGSQCFGICLALTFPLVFCSVSALTLPMLPPISRTFLGNFRTTLIVGIGLPFLLTVSFYGLSCHSLLSNSCWKLLTVGLSSLLLWVIWDFVSTLCAWRGGGVLWHFSSFNQSFFLGSLSG